LKDFEEDIDKEEEVKEEITFEEEEVSTSKIAEDLEKKISRVGQLLPSTITTSSSAMNFPAFQDSAGQSSMPVINFKFYQQGNSSFR
jgi:hypothetical protein